MTWHIPFQKKLRGHKTLGASNPDSLTHLVYNRGLPVLSAPPLLRFSTDTWHYKFYMENLGKHHLFKRGRLCSFCLRMYIVRRVESVISASPFLRASSILWLSIFQAFFFLKLQIFPGRVFPFHTRMYSKIMKLLLSFSKPLKLPQRSLKVFATFYLPFDTLITQLFNNLSSLSEQDKQQDNQVKYAYSDHSFFQRMPNTLDAVFCIGRIVIQNRPILLL